MAEMLSKICGKCNIKKKFDEFNDCGSVLIGKQSYCTKCQAIDQKNRRRTKKGLITKIHSAQIISSRARGHTAPNYTLNEFREWIYSQNIFHILYNNWVNSDYDKMLIPSIDRIIDSKPYSFNNIKITTWRENDAKGRISKRKSVLQLDFNDDKIQEYSSLTEASLKTGIAKSSISHCCNDNRKEAGGYNWIFCK